MRDSLFTGETLCPVDASLSVRVTRSLSLFTSFTAMAAAAAAAAAGGSAERLGSPITTDQAKRVPPLYASTEIGL